MDTKERLNNTIELVYEILENDKDNSTVKEAYEDIKKLKEKRKLN